MVPDSEEEALMVNAAIEASHKTARRETRQRSGAGPSTSRSRVTAGEAVMDTMESDEEFYEHFAKSDDESELSVVESSDDEPVTKRKGKAKAKPEKGKAKISTELLTWAERSEQRRLARQERNEAKREQRLLAKRLGRRLTWVCPRSAYQTGFVQHISQAEKTSLALEKYHPELKVVWGDLEEQVPVITPEKAEQPAGLKVTLLPFQQESLWWMRKQEKNSIWHGGLLAVSVYPIVVL